MRSMILAIAAGASLTLASVGADAMPAGVIAGPTAAPQVELVAGGCGFGFHPGPYGGCVRGRGGYYRPAYGYYRPYYRPRCGIRVGPIGIGGPC